MTDLRQEVDNLDPNRLLNTSPSDLAEYLVDKYIMTAPIVRRDQWTASEIEASIDVRYHPDRWIMDKSRPCLVPGQRITIEVPVEGEMELFQFQASTQNFSPPYAIIRGNSLFLSFEIPGDSQQKRDIQAEANGILDQIVQHLGWIENDLRPYNTSLPTEAERSITARRERIIANKDAWVRLGYQ